MNTKLSRVAMAMGLAGSLFSMSVNAAPGQPRIEWMETNFALVEVAESGTAYNQVITKKDFAEVPVSWAKSGGTNGSRVEYRLNGEVVLTQTVAAGGTAEQTGSATLQVVKGGQYNLEVALCDDTGCTASAATAIKVEDTDGSHMDPLVLTPNGTNKPYVNKSNSVVGSYFVEWGVYGRKYTVDQMAADNLTHILYGFIPICGPNESLRQANASGHGALMRSCEGLPDSSVAIHDLFAAVQKGQKGASTGSYKGNFGQLMALKQAQPDLKILPSVGGWTLSDPFYAFSDPIRRKVFVDSSEEFLRTWKFFDGIDIDWEYPGGGGANPDLGDPVNGGNTYLLLMQELRTMLDGLSAETGRDYQLTSAVGAARSKITKIDYAAVSQVIDNIFLMSYDFYGAFDLNTLGHMTGVNPPEFRPGDPQTQDFNVSSALDIIEAQGADMSKVAVGTAMYGRGWTGVSGFAPGASPMTGTATGAVAGSWEAGVVDYKDIVEYEKDPAWTKGYDQVAQAPYIFKASTGDLISYDDAQSVMAKGAIVKRRQLAGLFAWEIDADNGDILNAMHESLGHGDSTGNSAPIANAGADQIVTPTSPALTTLVGNLSSDPDGDAVTYAWTQTAGTPVTLSGANMANATFTAPTVTADQTLTFELSVSDAQYTSTDRVNVTLKADNPTNAAPTISLPADMTVASLADFSVAATVADPDGDAVTVTWDVPAGFQTVSTGANNVALKAPSVTVDTAFSIGATVSDGSLSSVAALTVTVTAADTSQCGTNTDPNAGNYDAWSAGAAYNGGAMVSHNGLVYKAKWWTQGNNPTAADSPWELVSAVELPWNATTAYNGADEVNHDGRRYRAAYWTRGEEPGTAAVWTDIGAASCP